MHGLKNKGLGNWERIEIPAINRTGAATVKGGVYALDVTRVQGESTDAETTLSNVTGAVTANLNGILVVALGAYADNQAGQFLLYGVENVMVDGDGTDVTVGLRLVPANGSTSLFAQSTAVTVNACGLALEANDGAAALKQVLFDGRNWKASAPAS